MAASSAVGHLSVQAIKGRFEQMQDVSFSCSSVGCPRATPPCRRRQSPFSPVDPSSNRDSPLPNAEAVNETSNNLGVAESQAGGPQLVDPHPRPRSRSVGTPTIVDQRNGKGGGGVTLSPIKKMTGSHYPISYSMRNESGDGVLEVGPAASIRLPSSGNFSSFSEKQKLVESIVMNIKTSAAMARKKDEEQRSKDFKAKELLMSTSKFEKNLKNVLERGVLRKWNEKAIREDNKHFRETFLVESKDNDIGVIRQRQRQILNNAAGPNRERSLSKINSILGVELYPLESSASNELASKDFRKRKELDKSQNNPVMLSKSNIKKQESPTDESCHQPRITNVWEETLKTSHSGERSASPHFPNPHEERAWEKTRSESDLIANSHNEKSEKAEPVRPPRKRRGKKGMAPQPPSSPFGDLGDRSFSLQGRSNQEQPSPITSEENAEEASEKSKEHQLVKEDKSKECDNSVFFSLSYESSVGSPFESGKDFNYEESCETNLENENVFFDKDSGSIDETFGDSDNKEGDGNQFFNSCDRISSSEPCLDVTASLPSGAPPKKPPRTFAYDIYRALKTDEVEGDSRLTSSTPKLSPVEVESLYTKPVKRLKEKPSFLTNGGASVPSKSTTDQSITKPAIAPKPADIVTRAKQRLSVSEPLPSAAESKEFSGWKPAVKRNSSFRFSFRKHKKSSNAFPSPIALRLDSQVGKRLKGVTRNLHPKKSEKEKRVRFQSGGDSKIIYDDVEEGPIYAVPSSTEVRSLEKPQELHYMCSPLFQYKPKASRLNHSSGPLKENCPPSPQRWEFRDRLRIMDGFKEDLRQSCRLVQKRLKGTAAGSAHHHR